MEVKIEFSEYFCYNDLNNISGWCRSISHQSGYINTRLNWSWRYVFIIIQLVYFCSLSDMHWTDERIPLDFEILFSVCAMFFLYHDGTSLNILNALDSKSYKTFFKVFDLSSVHVYLHAWSQSWLSLKSYSNNL